MQAELKIAGLDEVIQKAVEKAVKEAVNEIIKPLLGEFKSEIAVIASDELMKENLWNVKDICKFAKCSAATFYKKYKRCKDFPEPLDTGEKKNIKFDKIKVLKFFVRHPEFGLSDIAKRNLKETNETNN